MKISDLPTDLVEEILCRVSITSLKRAQSTCKRWNNLFKDRGFMKKHLGKGAKQSLVLMFKEFRIFLVSVNLNVAPPLIEFTGKLGLTDSHSNNPEQVDIWKVFYCDGLLLCTTTTTTKDNRLVVWNPYMGETMWIQFKPYPMMTNSDFFLGYQENKTCRSYKILRWLRNSVDQFEIYEFCSNSWRVLNVVNLIFLPIEKGVSLKGNTYWRSTIDYTYLFLLRFDFTTERFERLCFPDVTHSSFNALSVVGDEQLSLISHGLSKIEMWVTNNIDTEDALSWSKSFTVELRARPKSLRVFSNLLFDQEKKVALFCSLNDGTTSNIVYTIGEDDEYYKEIPYIESTNKPWWVLLGDHSENYPVYKKWVPYIFSYVPSLAQLQQGREAI